MALLQVSERLFQPRSRLGHPRPLGADVEAQKCLATLAQRPAQRDADPRTLGDPVLHVGHAQPGSGEIHPGQIGGLHGHRFQAGNGVDFSVKQAAIADRLIITKTDMAESDAQIEELTERLRALNPAAPIIASRTEDVDPTDLFGTGLFDPTSKTVDFEKGILW